MIRARDVEPKVLDSIWYWDLNDKSNNTEWIRYEKKLPHKMNKLDYDTVLAFDYLVFIFYHSSREIFCLDLISGEIEEVNNGDCEVRLGQYSKMIVTENHIIHSICLDSFGPIHLKIDAKQLIPDNILQSYDERRANLVCGYIKRHCMYDMPLEPQILIFKYYCVRIM